MANEKATKRELDTAELLKILIIVELAKAGVPQPEIRRVLHCDMWRVSEIARLFKNQKRDK
jgi:hypothetical protein